MNIPRNPARLTGTYEPVLSRWLWIVKIVLAIPHYIVLAFLWLAFIVLTFFAFAAVLFTGVYPRKIFDFNLGVLRWTWRVNFYAVGAFATDRYPPFTLAYVPDYPAHLDIDYPMDLPRGWPLIKSWFLGVPHYLIVGVFVGGGVFASNTAGNGPSMSGPPGLIDILVITAGLVLLFVGSYPRSIFDLVMGLDRWVVRVIAYGTFMTSQYPPFRLDTGSDDGVCPPKVPAQDVSPSQR